MRKCSKSIHLSLADIHCVITTDTETKLYLSARHSAFQLNKQEIENESQKKIDIRICSALPDPITSPQRIWEVTSCSSHWKVFDYSNESRIYVYQQDNDEPYIISFSKQQAEVVWIRVPQAETVEILQYPLDIILLYFLSQFYPLLIVHASGFVLGNCGHVCLGKSGAGKSTLFSLAARQDGILVQDDRLILRKKKEGWFMYPMPLNSHDRPVSVPVNRLNTLVHCSRNLAIPLTGNIKFSQFLPHMVHYPNWNNIYAHQLHLVEDLLKSVRFFQFFFTPDLTAIQYLQYGKDPGKSPYLPPEKPVPSKIKSFWKKYDTKYSSW